jgi:predicted RNase H-like HicB family nuclease
MNHVEFFLQCTQERRIAGELSQVDVQYKIPFLNKLLCSLDWSELSLRMNCKEFNMRQVIVFPGEDNYWVVECPSLPGCISQGKTREEAISNIREAIEGYIFALQEDNLEVPPERFEALLVAV